MNAISEIKNRLSDECVFPYEGITPKLHPSVFLAPGSKVIGDVEMKEGSSLWFNTVVRGDVHYIKIGKFTNIQDCSMLHVTNNKFPLNLGNNITVGHSVILHGCTINDESLIGMGAIILDGARVNKHSIVAAGAVVTQGFEIPEGKVAAGVPCKIIRDVTKDEIEEMKISALRYFNYAEKTLKSFTEITQTT